VILLVVFSVIGGMAIKILERTTPETQLTHTLNGIWLMAVT
jgi:hypothetical protein